MRRDEHARHTRAGACGYASAEADLEFVITAWKDSKTHAWLYAHVTPHLAHGHEWRAAYAMVFTLRLPARGPCAHP